jgi:hypothetical protein
MQRYLLVVIFLIANISNAFGQKDANIPSDHNNILITNVESVKMFLNGERVKYDEIWIPAEIDISKYKAALKEYLRQNADANAPRDSNLVNSKFILEHFNEYSVRYSGFIKEGKKSLIFQMIGHDSDENSNNFSHIFDGGYWVVIVVIEVENKKIIKIRCHGEA